MHSVKRAFFWLSGAGTDTLEKCPNWEQRKYVAFGATVLVPCAFAFIASAYALSTLTDKPLVIYPVAALWSFIILTIDRALLAGYRANMSFGRKMTQFALRFVVAVLMGVTIAHPLVLLLFRDTVNTVIEKDRAAEIETVRAGFDKTKAKVRGEVATLEQAVADQREKWNDSFQAQFIIQKKTDPAEAIPGLTEQQQQELKKATTEATAPFSERFTAANDQLAELTPQYTKLQSELGFWQAEFERELNGQRSGMAGEGPRAKSIRTDQLEPRRGESKRLSSLMEHLTAEQATLEKQIREAEAAAIATFEGKLKALEAAGKAEADRVAALKRTVEEDQAKSFVTQQNALRETIKVQIDTRLTELKRVQDELAGVTKEESERLAAIRAEPRRDILTQTLALHALFEAGEEGGKFAFYTYLVLTALFMLVDTIPLMVKFFMKAGPYDSLVDQDEIRYDAEHKSFRQNHDRYMAGVNSGNLASVTRNKRLESALIDGVEHTRAAREFLDSLIEMEKAFAEKMRIEEEAMTSASPAKLAMIEAIKKRFYDDMHERMEKFFASQPAAG